MSRAFAAPLGRSLRVKPAPQPRGPRLAARRVSDFSLSRNAAISGSMRQIKSDEGHVQKGSAAAKKPVSSEVNGPGVPGLQREADGTRPLSPFQASRVLQHNPKQIRSRGVGSKSKKKPRDAPTPMSENLQAEEFQALLEGIVRQNEKSEKKPSDAPTPMSDKEAEEFRALLEGIEKQSVKSDDAKPTGTPSHWGATARFLNLKELEKPPLLVYHPKTRRLVVGKTCREDENNEAMTFMYRHFPGSSDLKSKAIHYQKWDTLFYLYEVRNHRVLNSGRTKRLLNGSVQLATHRILTLVRRSAGDRKYYNLKSVRRILPPIVPRQMDEHVKLSPEQARLYMETEQGRLSILWLAVNAPLFYALRLIIKRSQEIPSQSNLVAYGPHQNTLTSLLADLHAYFMHYKIHVKTLAPFKLNSWDQDIPVVIGFRSRYIWFVWKGGLEDGVLVAQWTGNWIPDFGELMPEMTKQKNVGKYLDPKAISDPATFKGHHRLVPLQLKGLLRLSADDMEKFGTRLWTH